MSRTRPTSTDKYQRCILSVFNAHWGDFISFNYDTWGEVQRFNEWWDEKRGHQ